MNRREPFPGVVPTELGDGEKRPHAPPVQSAREPAELQFAAGAGGAHKAFWWITEIPSISTSVSRASILT